MSNSAGATRHTLTDIVESPDDHDRAAREMCQTIAQLVDDALETYGHPVELEITAEVKNVE